MGYYERHDLNQNRNRQGRHEGEERSFEPRPRRPFGDEDFDQDRESWREPMEFERRSGRLQWGGESLERGYYPRQQSPFGREPQPYPREFGDYGHNQGRQQPREWGGEQQHGGFRVHGPYTGKGPKGYRRSDERILEDVNQALYDCGALDASEIEVACQGGEIVLKGTVEDRRAKRIAEAIAEEQSGVRDVRNEIRIGSQPQPQSTGRGPRSNA